MMEPTTLQRLLRHPHAAVFDKAPASELALRIRHADGAVWSVAEGVLTVTAGDDAPVVFALKDYTIATLAAALVSAGFEVPLVAANWSPRSALALVEGDGDDAVSNGDHVAAFTSLLWALYSGYAGEVREAGLQVSQALRQMVITQSEGEWLDLWGTLYGDARRQDEVDEDFAPRIPQEAFRVRVNTHGIELAIRDATGWDVRIDEPWKDVFHLDDSLLSGPHRFYDGARYGPHLIQPTTREDGVSWDVVLPIIERNRAAGVLVLPPLVFHNAVVDGSGALVAGGLTRYQSAFDRYQDRALLDYNVTLSDNADVILNHASRHNLREVRRFSQSVIVSQTWIDYPWGIESWASLSYVVRSGHARDYRTFYSSVTYAETWAHDTSWAGADGTWTMGPLVRSDFTRRLSTDALLKEDGGYLLKEDGFKIYLE